MSSYSLFFSYYRVVFAGIQNILLGAMDAQIGKEMVAARINSFSMYERTGNQSGGVGASHLAWGGESFHKMGRQKITLARLFLGFELNLLLVDVDVVILRNVMHYFAKWVPTRVLSKLVLSCPLVLPSSLPLLSLLTFHPHFHIWPRPCAE